MLLCLSVLLLALAPPAQSKVNLAPVPRGESRLPLRPTYTIVKSGGILYKRFSTTGGDLMVIDSQPLKKETIEAGKCSRFRGSNPAGEEVNSVEILRANVPISSGEWAAFGALVQATVQDKCSETQVALRELPALQLGFSKTVTKKDGSKRVYQLFNQNLGTNLNFGMQF